MAWFVDGEEVVDEVEDEVKDKDKDGDGNKDEGGQEFSADTLTDWKAVLKVDMLENLWLREVALAEDSAKAEEVGSTWCSHDLRLLLFLKFLQSLRRHKYTRL